MIVRNDNIVRVPDANEARFETPELSTDPQPDYTKCCMCNLWDMHHALRLLIDITYPEDQFQNVRYSLLYFFDPLDFKYYEFGTFLDRDPIVAKRAFLEFVQKLRDSSNTYTAYIVDEYYPVIRLENEFDANDCYEIGLEVNEKGKIIHLSLDYKHKDAKNPSHQELLDELFETDGMTFMFHQHPDWIVADFASYLQAGLEDKGKLYIIDKTHTDMNPDSNDEATDISFDSDEKCEGVNSGAEYFVVLCDEQYFKKTWRDWSYQAEADGKKILMLVAFDEDFKRFFDRTPENISIAPHYLGRLWYPEEQSIYWDQDGNDLRDAYFLLLRRMKNLSIRIDLSANDGIVPS